jgi:hypothetical protein
VPWCRQEDVHEFPAYSWVAAQQGQRVFFEGAAHLPQGTPAPLLEARQQELEALRVGGRRGLRRAACSAGHAAPAWRGGGSTCQLALSLPRPACRRRLL